MAGAPIAVKMPKWGLSMEEGKIVHWWKTEGEAVREGEDLVDIETTKINNTSEAPASGMLRRILCALDETVPVGALLAVIAEPDIPDAEVDAFIAEYRSRFAEDDTSAIEEQTLVLRQVETGHGRIQLGVTADDSLALTIVLLHGFSSDLNNWLFNIDALKSVARVVAVDLPGHGGSTKNPGDNSLEGLAQAVAAAVGMIGVDRAHFIGHSLGAAVAVQIGVDAPAMVQSLTLIAPPLILGGQISRKFLDGLVDAQRPRDLKAPLEMLVADPALISKDMIDGVMKAKRLDGADAWLGALRDRMLQGADFRVLQERLDEAPPALVIASRDDQIIGPIDEAALPKSWRLSWIDQAGHMPHLERSTEVNRLILNQITTH
jgi:pyruvate dehydrogenase E2 component (dihydrolipoamide acetyltransferase)